jgi:hypothetical protein
MADLSQLMKIAPTVGAQFAGINQRQDQQMNELRQMELQELMKQRMGQEQRAAAMHPLEMEAKRLGNQTTSAQLPGITADARKKAETADSEIDATNTENRMKAYTAVGTQLGSLAGALEGVDDIEKPQRFAESVESLNLPPKVKASIMKRYSQYHPSELTARMKADADKMLKSTAAYVQAMEQEKLRGQNQLAQTRAQGAEQRSLEKMRIDAGKYDKAKAKGDAKQQWDETVRKALAKGARSGYATLNAAATWAMQNNFPDLAAQYASQAEQIRPQAEAEISNLAPQPGKIDVPAVTGLPGTPNKSIAPPGQEAAPPKPAATGRVPVISPDGKRGSVPADQLDAALAAGYKRAQ